MNRKKTYNIFQVLFCSDRMVLIEEGTVFYESFNIEYLYPECVNISKNFDYNLFMAVAFGCCLCCLPSLIAFVVMAKKRRFGKLFFFVNLVNSMIINSFFRQLTKFDGS